MISELDVFLTVHITYCGESGSAIITILLNYQSNPMKKLLISIGAFSVLALTLTLVAVPAVHAQTNNGFCYNFTQNMGEGSYVSSADLSALQQVLTNEGFWSDSPITSYDSQVASAVSDFQQKYTAQILAPVGLSHGTGYVGPSTRAELNKLFECTNAAPIESSSSTCQPGWLFNPYTGVSCSNNQVVSNVCTDGALFNYLTGALCSKNITVSPFIASSTKSNITISPIIPGAASRGNNVTINWTSTNAPTGSAVVLTLFNSSGNEVGVLTQDADSTGSYVWSIPTCVSGPMGTSDGLTVMQVCRPTDSNGVYETPPGNYSVVAKLYTPKDGYGGSMIPSSPNLQILATSPAVPFTVIAPSIPNATSTVPVSTPTPSITVTSPNGGTVSATTQTVDWTSTGLGVTTPVTIIARTLATGDANGNGLINVADINIVRQNLGKSVNNGALSGDFDGDGVVNSKDLSIVQNNSGQSSDTTLATNIPNTGSYEVNLSSFPAGMAKIEVEATVNGNTVSAWSNYFIVATSTVPVSTPKN